MNVAHLISRFYDDLWNRWDDAGVDDVLAPDFAFRGSLGTSAVGRDAWRAYRDEVRAGASVFHNTVITLVVDGSSAATRLLFSGTHDGLLAGIPASGRAFEYEGAAFFESTAGKLTSAWVLGDLAGLRRQLDERT